MQDGNEPPDNSKDDETRVVSGVPLTVEVSTGRRNFLSVMNSPEAARVHHVIWQDGTRQQMQCELVNRDEIRGWWARRVDTFAFTTPVCNFKMIDFAAPPNGVALQAWCSWKLNVGQRAWRCNDTEYNPMLKQRHDVAVDYIFSGMDMDDGMVTLTERKKNPYGKVTNTFIELPVTKFIEDFNPCSRKRRKSPYGRDVEVVRLAFALSLATLWKIKVQWRRVHLICEAKKYAPGGIGHKRARAEFEAQRGGDGHILALGLAIRGFDILESVAARGQVEGV